LRAVNGFRKKKLKQKRKLIIYNKALDGNKIGEIKNEDEMEALQILNDFILAREFWYTPDEILEMPEDYYNDFLLLLNLESAKKKAEAEKQKRKR
jgi:hypothetical protein